MTGNAERDDCSTQSQPTFFWYDLETFGTDPKRDRIAQFAGQRTDSAYRPIGPAINLYCRFTDDCLPSPESCLITGLTPSRLQREGLPELEFARRVYREFSVPGTCVLGYNTLRFDDEFIRHLFYRNLIDPYAREWRDGCSRWDLIDVVRLCRALRPSGVAWAEKPDGTPSYKLEELSRVNGLDHSFAHDAASDIVATIALARLIREAQPKLFDYAFQNRGKQAVSRMLELFKPVIHVSEKFPARNFCVAAVAPLMPHPTDGNGVVVCDLTPDPTGLISASPEEIRRNLFTRGENRPANEVRFAIKTVHTNRCPILAPLSVLKGGDLAPELEIDLPRCQKHLALLRDSGDLPRRLADALSIRDFAPAIDAELQLYDGPFIGGADRAKLNALLTKRDLSVSAGHERFEDPRLPELIFRARARSHPDCLTDAEREQWRELRVKRLMAEQDGAGFRTFAEYFGEIANLRQQPDRRDSEHVILDDLEEYGRRLEGELGKTPKK